MGCMHGWVGGCGKGQVRTAATPPCTACSAAAGPLTPAALPNAAAACPAASSACSAACLAPRCLFSPSLLCLPVPHAGMHTASQQPPPWTSRCATSCTWRCSCSPPGTPRSSQRWAAGQLPQGCRRCCCRRCCFACRCSACCCSPCPTPPRPHPACLPACLPAEWQGRADDSLYLW